MDNKPTQGQRQDHMSLIDAAMEAADNGIPVFPVGRQKTPIWPKGKSPNGRDGFHAASTEADDIEALFDHPHARGIGMPTGRASNVTVIDVDCGANKKNRNDALAWLDQWRDRLRATTVVRTGSGGLHYYCQYTPGIPNASNVWAKGVDCRNDGGYVVIPPFMGYEFKRQIDPEDWCAPPPAPQSAVRRRAIPDAKDGQTPPQIAEMHDLIMSGTTWHDPVRDIIAHLVGAGWSDAEILRQTFTWTWKGHSPRETFDQMVVMINGARQKYDTESRPKTTHEARLSMFANLWNESTPETRREIADMIRKAEGK